MGKQLGIIPGCTYSPLQPEPVGMAQPQLLGLETLGHLCTTELTEETHWFQEEQNSPGISLEERRNCVEMVLLLTVVSTGRVTAQFEAFYLKYGFFWIIHSTFVYLLESQNPLGWKRSWIPPRSWSPTIPLHCQGQH